MWIDIKEKSPPFDQTVLLKGISVNADPDYPYYDYCIAYNECYPPFCNMSAVHHGYKFKKIIDAKGSMSEVEFSIYGSPSFEPTHWMLLGDE